MTSKFGNMEVIMNKEEILEKSRQENKGKDERELQAIAQGCKIAFAVGGILCVLFATLAWIHKDLAIFCSSYSVYFAMGGTAYILKYTKVRKKYELAFGIYFVLIAAALFAVYILRFILHIW